MFTGMMGESVMSCVRHLRLERAAGRLKQTRASVTDIAFVAGFESLEVFGQVPPEQWYWTMMIRTPDLVSDADVRSARQILLAKQ